MKQVYISTLQYEMLLQIAKAKKIKNTLVLGQMIEDTYQITVKKK